MLFLTEEHVHALANIDEVIGAIRDAFARDFHSTLHMPVRSQLDLGSSVLLLMPCYDSERQA